jgi:hypothetical protein
MDRGVPYIIEKLLELKCLKQACMTHLDTSNKSYDQKKGQESNWQFDSSSLKVGNLLNFLMCRWRATYCWKHLNKVYNFTLDLISIESLHAKLWAPKVVEVRIVGISGFLLRSPRTKWHLGASPVAKHKVYYKGKVMASPKSGPWWVLWVQICLWFILTPKMFQLCINQLVVWFCANPCEWLIACHYS